MKLSTTVLFAFLASGLSYPHPAVQGRCTEDNVIVRKSWAKLEDFEKQNYIEAIQCLRESPPRTPRSFAEGAKHRMDDFIVTHINQTLAIHFSGWLMPWHRYFVWLFEEELRETCGYTGSQPYWDWSDPAEAKFNESSVFSQTALSMGGNGSPTTHGLLNGTVPGVPSPQIVTRPPGTGGGCVTDGPFANTTLSMGPIFPLPVGEEEPSDYFAYRPHCLKRDFLQSIPDQFFAADKIENLLASTTLAQFRERADASVHFAGHSGVGGDMSDIFSSSQDPVFYLHHAQLDRLWTLWQLADPQSRTYQVSDTITYADSPPSRNVTIFDVLTFGHISEEVKMWKVLDTQGALCYRYE